VEKRRRNIIFHEYLDRVLDKAHEPMLVVQLAFGSNDYCLWSSVSANQNRKGKLVRGNWPAHVQSNLNQTMFSDILRLWNKYRKKQITFGDQSQF